MTPVRAVALLGAAIAVFCVRGARADTTAALTGSGVPPVKVQLVGDYDTNVAGSTPAFAALRGLSPEDERVSPELDLNYFHQIGIISYYLQGTGAYDFYMRNSILNRERILANGGSQAQVYNCIGTASGNYARRQSDLEDLTLATTVNTEEDIGASLSGTCNQSGDWIPSGTITQSWASNSNLIRKQVDNNSLSAQASLLYRNALLGEVSLQGEYVAAVYPNRIFSNSERDGYKMYGGGLKLMHQFGTRIVFTGSVSETSLRADNGLGSNFNGITYDTSLSYQVTPRLTGEVDFGRKTVPSDRIDATYSVDEIDSVHLNYLLTSEITLKLQGSETIRNYEGIDLLTGSDLTHEDIQSVSASAEYAFSPRTSVELAVYQDHRKADVAAYSYYRTQVELTLSRNF